MRVTSEVELPCPPEETWAVLMDWERQADWMLDADSVRVVSGHREGVGVHLAVRTRLFGVPAFTEPGKPFHCVDGSDPENLTATNEE